MRGLKQHPAGHNAPRCMHGCGNRYRGPISGVSHGHQCVYLYKHEGGCLFACEAVSFESLVAQVESLSDALNIVCMENDDIWAEVLKVPSEAPMIVSRRGVKRGSDANGWYSAVYQITKALKTLKRKRRLPRTKSE